jgi:hypothetical protein
MAVISGIPESSNFFLFGHSLLERFERLERSAAVEPFDELRAGYWNRLHYQVSAAVERRKRAPISSESSGCCSTLFFAITYRMHQCIKPIML